MSDVVSIIIPTHNREELVPRALDSCLSQTHAKIEILVIDDGSTDGTADVVADFMNRPGGEKVRYHCQKKQGAQTARNKGFALSTGDYIQFLDSDDYLHPQKLEIQLAHLKTHAQLDMVYCFSQLVGKEDEPSDNAAPLLWNSLEQWDDPIVEFLEDNGLWQTNAPLWRRSAVSQIGDWDEDLIVWQDWVFHLKALILGMNTERIPQVLNYIDTSGTNPNSLTIANSKERLRSRIRAGEIIRQSLKDGDRYTHPYRMGLLSFFSLILNNCIGADEMSLAKRCTSLLADISPSRYCDMLLAAIRALMSHRNRITNRMTDQLLRHYRNNVTTRKIRTRETRQST